VLIRIVVEARDPPTGDVQFGPDPAVGFVGWLALLKLLSDAIATSDVDAPESANGDSG
jgi:hypothetical protein